MTLVDLKKQSAVSLSIWKLEFSFPFGIFFKISLFVELWFCSMIVDCFPMVLKFFELSISGFYMFSV